MVRVIAVNSILILLVGCGSPDDSQAVVTDQVAISTGQSVGDMSGASVTGGYIKVTEAQFLERESGQEPYPVRMIFNDRHLRIDDGEGSVDFLLYDRETQDIFSVSSEDRSIFHIPPRKDLLLQEATITFSQRKLEDQSLPLFEGKESQYIEFQANGRTCYSVIAAGGVLPELVTIFSGYLSTLAGEQILNLNKTPVEMRNDCMLMNLIYKPTQHLEYGMPIREWDNQGYVRELVSIKQTDVKKSLFTLHTGYEKYTSKDVTEL